MELPHDDVGAFMTRGIRGGGSGPLAGQIIREPGYQPPVRHRAATGNGTIEHGEAPAGEGL